MSEQIKVNYRADSSSAISNLAISQAQEIAELKRENRILREALELILRRVALVSPYYEIARTALTPAPAVTPYVYLEAGDGCQGI